VGTACKMKPQQNETQPSDLVGEVLTSLGAELTQVHEQVKALTQKEAPDFSREFIQINTSLQAINSKLDKFQSPPAVSADPFDKHFKQLTFLIKERPEYKLSQFVQWGGFVFGLMVLLVALLTWKCLEWRGERDQYAQLYSQADWRLRYTRQANADYYGFMETKLAQDKGELRQWIIEQEQADQKRALAREAAEQAKALSEQANRLEGGSSTKGKKKNGK